MSYAAARLLDQLLDQQQPVQQLLVTPRRVVTRHSSDMVATRDEMVRRALTFIRAHASEAISIGDVLAAVPLSRRRLELRFKRVTGRTLQKEIWRVRLERAKEMLLDTDLPVAEISIRCGFSEPQRMTEVFSRELGMAPGAFRKTHRLRLPGLLMLFVARRREALRDKAGAVCDAVFAHKRGFPHWTTSVTANLSRLQKNNSLLYTYSTGNLHSCSHFDSTPKLPSASEMRVILKATW